VDENSLAEAITVCDEHTIGWDAAGEADKWMDGTLNPALADLRHVKRAGALCPAS
jgi:hypothetical protein